MAKLTAKRMLPNGKQPIIRYQEPGLFGKIGNFFTGTDPEQQWILENELAQNLVNSGYKFNEIPQSMGGGLAIEKPLNTPPQQKAMDQLLQEGLQGRQESLNGLRDLFLKQQDPYAGALQQIQGLGSAGASAGSFLSPLGSLAGTALGGPVGGAIGGALGSLGGSMFDRYQASQAFGPYEEAARRSFERETIPGIAERFAGTGSLSSSAFQNALGRAAGDLESQLATARANYSSQQMNEDLKRRSLANEQMNQLYGREQQEKNALAQYYQYLMGENTRNIGLGLGKQSDTLFQPQAPGFWHGAGPQIAQTGIEALIKAGLMAAL